MVEKIEYTYKTTRDKNDPRDKVIFARIKSNLYGRIWHYSQDSGVSMSKIAELCLEKYSSIVFDEVMSYGKEKRKEKFDGE
jgi:hypothetical protein